MARYQYLVNTNPVDQNFEECFSCSKGASFQILYHLGTYIQKKSISKVVVLRIPFSNKYVHFLFWKCLKLSFISRPPLPFEWVTLTYLEEYHHTTLFRKPWSKFRTKGLVPFRKIINIFVCTWPNSSGVICDC